MTRDVIRRLSHLCTLALCAGVFLCMVMVGAAVRPLLGGTSAGSRRWVAAAPLFVETPSAVATERRDGHAPLTKRTWRRATSRRTMRTMLPRAQTAALADLVVGLPFATIHDTQVRHVPRSQHTPRRRGAHAPTRAPPGRA